MKNRTVWLVECDKFEMPLGNPTIHCVSIRKRRGTGEIHANTVFTVQQRCGATKNRPWLTIVPFNIYLQSFPIQKLFIFIVISLSLSLSLSLFYCWKKSLPKTTLMPLNWETAFKKEITRWRHRWLIRPPDDLLFETLDQTNAAFYPVRHFLPTIFRRALLSAVSARWKTSLRNTMTDERLSSLAILHYT